MPIWCSIFKNSNNSGSNLLQPDDTIVLQALHNRRLSVLRYR